VHSACSVGFDSARITGRSLIRDMLSMTFCVKAPPMVLTPMIVVGLDALDSSDEIPRRRVLVCIRFLKINEVLAGRFQQTVDVEHVEPGLRFLEAHTLPTSAEQSRLARPIPAEPAPRNRYFSSFSFVPLSWLR